METNKDKTNIWINIQEASSVLGLSEQTLKKQCRRGEFVFKIVKKGKRANYFIMLKSMPDFAQDKYLGEQILRQNILKLQVGQNNRLKNM